MTNPSLPSPQLKEMNINVQLKVQKDQVVEGGTSGGKTLVFYFLLVTAIQNSDDKCNFGAGGQE